jgi:hypothetical protein
MPDYDQFAIALKDGWRLEASQGLFLHIPVPFSVFT